MGYIPDYSNFLYIMGGEGWLKIGDKEYYPQPGELSYKNLRAARKLTAVLDYIAGNIEQNITIHDLAEIAYIHPNYFMRLFKQQIGVPPIQYSTPGLRPPNSGNKRVEG